MKKIILGLIGILGLVTALYAGVLTATEINGTKTYCYYSDGGILVINGMSTCPTSN